MNSKNEKEEIFKGDRKDFITYAKEAIGQIPLEVKFTKLDKLAVIPTYAHDGDVGMDMTAIGVEYDNENDMYIYHTGLAFETEKHYGMLLFPRSSNRRTDAYLCNHVGIADTAIYRGEIIFCFKNRTSLETRAENVKIRCFFNDITINSFSINDAAENAVKASKYVYEHPMDFAPYKIGDRIGQMVIFPYPNVKLVEWTRLSETERGNNGFGSTGN